MTNATDTGSTRKRRSDFEANRELILGAADAAFAELGMSASIASVAERAGVAPATVYRHFPTRADLVDAVFELRIVEYVDAIEAANALEDPREAFRTALHAIVDLQSRDRSFREIVAERVTEPEQVVDQQENPQLARLGNAFLAMLSSARKSGVLRSDANETDVMTLLIATEGVARQMREQSPEALTRMVDVILDGLCGERTALGGSRLDYEQIVEINRG